MHLGYRLQTVSNLSSFCVCGFVQLTEGRLSAFTPLNSVVYRGTLFIERDTSNGSLM